MSVANLLSSSGRTLSLAAWFFGAIALGAGNAYFGVPPSSGYTEHQASVVSVSDTMERCHTAPSSETAEIPPAHCLFCLEGLAAVEPAEPRLLIGFSNSIVKRYRPQYQKHLGLTGFSIAQPRGPPTISPS